MKEKIITLDPAAPILPPWAAAAVYFVAGAAEYIFAARKQIHEGSETISKFVRPVDVAAAFVHQQHDTGWIENGVVRIGNSVQGSWFLYYRGAAVISLRFDGDPRKYVIPIPSTVLAGVGHAYYIFAVKEAGVLRDATPIYRAPFPNVYDDGRICWGSNRVPRMASPVAAAAVWRDFFATPFNEHLDSGKITSQETKLIEVLKSLEGRKRFPARLLIPHAYNLRSMQDVLIKIIQTGESDGD